MRAWRRCDFFMFFSVRMSVFFLVSQPLPHNFGMMLNKPLPPSPCALMPHSSSLPLPPPVSLLSPFCRPGV